MAGVASTVWTVGLSMSQKKGFQMILSRARYTQPSSKHFGETQLRDVAQTVGDE